MSVLSLSRKWLGKVIGLEDGEFFSAYYGGSTWAGKAVTEENSLNSSAWWRCVRLYADVVGALPFKFYERVTDDDRQQAPKHYVSGLIGNEPNDYQTGPEFWSGLAAGLAMCGNGLAEKKMIGPRVIELHPLPLGTAADRSRNRDRRLEYRYTDRGKDEWLPPEKVFHVRGFTLGKADMGLSPLGAARQSLSIALATEEAVGRTFAQGMRASGFFTGPKLNADQRKDFKTTFIDPIVGNDAQAHYGILENGFDFKPININPRDAEMLVSRRFNVEDICRFMGVPPILAGHASEGQTAWGTGIEAIINQWLTSGLNSFLTNIEKAVNKRIIAPLDKPQYYAEFERGALLRTDSAAQAEVVNKLVQTAQLTPNEGRRLRNMPKQEGGDVLLVNSTLVPLKSVGQRPPAKVQPAPGEPIPQEDDDEE